MFIKSLMMILICGSMSFLSNIFVSVEIRDEIECGLWEHCEKCVLFSVAHAHTYNQSWDSRQDESEDEDKDEDEGSKEEGNP